MNMKMIMMISMMINILFLNFNNPLIMIILLIFQTLTLSIIMGKMYYNFWFSYIMFLVFIGGLFIIFIYIISLTYNNKFFMLLKKKMYWMYLIMLILLISKLKYNYFFIMNQETNLSLMNNMINKEINMNMMKFFNFPNNFINLLMILYLFIMMIIVVKITNFMKGPIRSMN